MAGEALGLSGGTLDLSVIQGRRGAFVIPLASDLTSYTWTGQARSNDGDLLGTFDIVVTTSQAAISLPATLTAVAPPRARYEIALTAPGGEPQTLMSGALLSRSGVIV